MRVRDGITLLSDGPPGSTQAFITDFEVVSCAGRPQAIELAATHPFARQHPIEVRPFWQG